MSEEVEVQPEAAVTAYEPEVTAAEQEIVEDKPVKTFTQEELDSIVARRVAKEQRKLQRQAELEVENRMLKEQLVKPVTTESKAPSQEEYASYEEYLEAKAEWIADKRLEAKLAEREKREAQSRAEAERGEVARTWQQKVEAATTKYADYHEALEDVDHIEIPPTLTGAIMESDMGADIAYYLAKNPGDLERIVKLKPHAALMELGKIEVKLSQAPAPKKTVSKAPAPIKPLGGGSAVNTAHDPNDDMETFIRKRNLEKGRIK